MALVAAFFEGPVFVIEDDVDDPQEVAGDPYADLEPNDCLCDFGHLFKTQCGETKCLWCGRISWT